MVVIPSTDKNDLAGLLFEDVIKNLEQEGVSELGGMMDSKNSFSIRFHERLGAEFVGDYMRGKDKWLLIKYSIKHV